MKRHAHIRYLIYTLLTLGIASTRVINQQYSLSSPHFEDSPNVKRGFIRNLCPCLNGNQPNDITHDELLIYSLLSEQERDSEINERAAVGSMWARLTSIVDDSKLLNRSLRDRTAIERLTPEDKRVRLEVAIADWNACKFRYKELSDSCWIAILARYEARRLEHLVTELNDVCTQSKAFILQYVDEYRVDLFSDWTNAATKGEVNFDMKDVSKQFLEHETHSDHLQFEEAAQQFTVTQADLVGLALNSPEPTTELASSETISNKLTVLTTEPKT